MAITTKIERRIHDGGIQALNRAQNDMNEALANITGLGEDTRTDIVNSVLAGNTVTTHSMPINMGDWRGFGYVVFNPQTFSSVYMIDGGPRGGATGSSCGCDEQAYNSFIDAARFAGSTYFCEDFIDNIVDFIYSMVSELYNIPILSDFLVLIAFLKEHKELSEDMTTDEAAAVLFVKFQLLIVGMMYLTPYIFALLPPGINIIVAAAWIALCSVLYAMIIDICVDELYNSTISLNINNNLHHITYSGINYTLLLSNIFRNNSRYVQYSDHDCLNKGVAYA